MFSFTNFGQITLHLSHKEGNSSSEVKFFCNLLYIAAMDLSTYIGIGRQLRGKFDKSESLLKDKSPYPR